jgi:immune inhibitor A
MRRAFSAASALAVAVTLPILTSPAQATPDAPTFAPATDGHASTAVREDNRLHPLAARQSRLRQAAVGKLASGDARLVGTGINRTIRLANGSTVGYPVTQTAQLLTFLVDFGGSGDDEETHGPRAGEIPEPEASDNSTYWKDPATGGFARQHYLDMFFNGMVEQGGDSFRDAYREMSSGRFDVEGDVSDWVRVDRPEAYYGANDATGHDSPEKLTDFIQDSADAWYGAQLEDMGPDDVKDYLGKFDTWDRYDADHDGNYNEPDGYIDHFQAIHAGVGEDAGAPSWTIWSQRSGAGYWADTGPDSCPSNACQHQGGVEIGDSGYYILDYTTEPENGGLGVFAHEFGHDLGLPDYYDTQGGDNGTGFWNLMSAGSWLGHGDGTIGTTPGQMAATDKFYLGWYGPRRADGSYDDLAVVDGLADDPTAVALGPSFHASTTGKQAVLVSLPDGERADGPFAGSHDGAYLYSGLHDAATVDADSPPVAVPSSGDATLTARVAYQIEPGFDHAFLRASTDDGEHWTDVPTSLSVDPNHTDPENGDDFDLGITGTSGAMADPDQPWWSPTASWVPLHADLSDYAGQTIHLRWEYYTDPRTNGAGFAVDEIAIGDLTSDLGSTDDWDLDGFHSVVDGTYAITYPRYYLAENRQYRGYDATLETGPYSWDYENSARNRVDQFPYQDGLLVWYVNGLYGDNNTGIHPGVGAALPVDAAHQVQVWRDESGTPSSLADGRLQTYDSTFDVDRTDPLQLTREVRESDDTETLDVRSRPSAPVFDDSDPTAYLDDSLAPFSLWYSTTVAGAGAMIHVVSSDESTGRMDLEVGRRFVAALGKPAIAGTAQPGRTLTASAPAWFQTGVTTTVSWLRDGNLIAGSGGSSYRVQVADVGHTLSARITGAKSGYTPTTATASSSRVGKAKVGLAVRHGKVKQGRKVSLAVRATSHGVRVPGKVRLRYAGRSLGEVRLKSGTARVKLPGRKRGSYRLTVTYPGATGFGPASRTITIRVR